MLRQAQHEGLGMNLQGTPKLEFTDLDPSAQSCQTPPLACRTAMVRLRLRCAVFIGVHPCRTNLRSGVARARPRICHPRTSAAQRCADPRIHGRRRTRTQPRILGSAPEDDRYVCSVGPRAGPWKYRTRMNGTNTDIRVHPVHPCPINQIVQTTRCRVSSTPARRRPGPSA